MRFNCVGQIADCGRDPCGAFILYLFHGNFYGVSSFAFGMQLNNKIHPKNYTSFHHEPFQNLRDHNFNAEKKSHFFCSQL